MQKVLKVREATPEDMEAIRACHGEIEEQVGEKLDLLDVEDRAALGYWVVEKDGKIIGGMYFEKSARQCHFGTDPEATAALRSHQQEILGITKAAGIRFVHCDVFRGMETTEAIGKHLEQSGYVRRDDLIDYTVDLRG